MKGSRFKLNQNHDTKLHEALETFRRMRVVPFDVPGHKRGRGNPELTEFLGQKCVGVDVNSMKPLDNLCHPVSVIREAEELAACFQEKLWKQNQIKLSEREETADLYRSFVGDLKGLILRIHLEAQLFEFTSKAEQGYAERGFWSNAP